LGIAQKRDFRSRNDRTNGYFFSNFIVSLPWQLGDAHRGGFSRRTKMVDLYKSVPKKNDLRCPGAPVSLNPNAALKILCFQSLQSPSSEGVGFCAFAKRPPTSLLRISHPQLDCLVITPRSESLAVGENATEVTIS
jgi:hypothetical protein